MKKIPLFARVFNFFFYVFGLALVHSASLNNHYNNNIDNNNNKDDTNSNNFGLKAKGGDGPFTNWLSNLALVIPPIASSSALGSLSINDLKCTNLTLQALKSNFVPPLGYSIGLEGIQINCFGYWDFKVIGIDSKGTASISLNPSSLDLQILFDKDSDGLIAKTSLSVCNPNIQIGNVDLQGDGLAGLGTAIINFIIGVFKSNIQSSIDGLICPLLGPLITNNITSILTNLNGLVRPYLKPPDPQIPPPPLPEPAKHYPINSTISDLTSSGIILSLDYLISRVVGSNGPLGINKIVDLFTNPKGSLVLQSAKPSEPSKVTLSSPTSIPQSQPEPRPAPVSESENFSQNALFNKFMGGTSKNVNELMTSMLNDALGPILIPISLGSLTANLSLSVKRFSLDGLDSWAGLRLTQPIDPYTLLMDTKTDYLNFSLSFGINVTIPGDNEATGSIIAGNGGRQTLVEAGTLQMNLTHSHFSAFFQILASSPILSSLDIDQLLGGGLDCLSASFIGANIPKLYFSTLMESIFLKADVNGGAVELEIDTAFNDLIDVFVSSFGQAIPALFNGLVDSLLKDTLNSLFEGIHNQTIAHARSKNPAMNNYDPTGTQELANTLCPPQKVETAADQIGMDGTYSLISLTTALVLWFVICLILYYVIKRISRRSSKMRAYSSGRDSQLFINNAAHSLLSENDKDNNKHHETTSIPVSMPKSESMSKASFLAGPAGDESLASHPSVNTLYRYGVPLIILLNIALFVSSNTGVGADVRVRIGFPGTEMWYGPLFSFSLGGTVHDMWTAGVYALALFIAVFSGAWPYLKLFLMLVSWVVPRRYMSRKWRERGLMMLDALGKWSLIDAYVMTLMMVAFRFNIAMPTPDKISAGNSTMLYSDWGNSTYSNSTAPYVPAAIDVFVIPDWGIYSFMAATILSLIITHVVLHVHRQVARPATLAALEADSNKSDQSHLVTGPGSAVTINSPSVANEKLALCNFIRRERNRRWAVSTLGKVSVVVLLFASCCMIIAGSVVYAFAFEFAGAVSIALPVTKTNYSLLSLGWNLPNASDHPNFFGIRFIQASYLLFAFCVPVAHTIVLIALWVAPLTLTAQGKMLSAVEVLNAWSALEVFVLSIMASILQVRQFASFIVGDKCDFLAPILSVLAVQLNIEDKCFDVIATLDTGCWILFGAVLEYMVARYAVMKLCHDTLGLRRAEAIRRIETGMDDEDDEDEEESDDEDLEPHGVIEKVYRCLRAPFIKSIPRGSSKNLFSNGNSQSNSRSGSKADLMAAETQPHGQYSTANANLL